MTNSFPNIARFDAYLMNEMRQEERVQFEQELNSNLYLSEEFLSHKKFLEDFCDGIEYREITKNLKAIHKSIYYPEKNFFTSRQFYIPLAVAASFVFFLVVINPWIKEGSTSTHVGDSGYEENSATATDSTTYELNTYASEQVQKMEMTDDANVQSKPSSALLSPLNTLPSGTAFMISVDGYFLTSQHLVGGLKIIRLQQKEENLTFEVEVVFEDSIRDFAVLKCNETIAQNFKAVPFRLSSDEIFSDAKVFTMGYPKNEIVYSESVISSQSGYANDTSSFEIALKSNNKYSGAPLFSYNGDLIGMISSNNSRQQSVTYVLDHHYIQRTLDELKEIENVNMSRNYNLRPKNHDDLIKWYRPFIFEVHP